MILPFQDKSYMEALIKRFNEGFKEEDGCWNWIWNTIDGYGRTLVKDKSLLAHRVSYELHIGEIPDGIYVLHKCDNPGCVNPDHLFLGTNTDNMRDMVNKSRHFGQKKTHCKSGHEFNEENTIVNKYGHRNCRICMRKATKDHYWRSKDSAATQAK